MLIFTVLAGLSGMAQGGNQEEFNDSLLNRGIVSCFIQEFENRQNLYFGFYDTLYIELKDDDRVFYYLFFQDNIIDLRYEKHESNTVQRLLTIKKLNKDKYSFTLSRSGFTHVRGIFELSYYYNRMNVNFSLIISSPG